MIDSIEEKSYIIIRTLTSLYDNIRKASSELGRERLENGYNKILPKGSHYYIPSHSEHLAAVLNILYKLRKKTNLNLKVCDLGCGDGLFLQYIGAYLREIYTNISIELHGVEYDKNIAPCGHNLVIERDDFFEISMKYISKFDYIYAYNPLCGSEPNIALLERTIKGMKKGSVFIFSNSSVNSEELRKLKFERYRQLSSVHYFIKK